MKNPWEEISLDDYENHMKLGSVMQLQAMNEMMKGQFEDYPVSSVMILGIAGGNGLEHISRDKFEKVYGVDVNSEYLKEVVHRYSDLDGLLECLCINLIDEADKLPKADMVIANLLIEYIGYECFQKAVRHIIQNMFHALFKLISKIPGYQIHHICMYLMGWNRYIIKWRSRHWRKQWLGLIIM